ncbi:MAG: hypothetical protein PVI46_14520 [Lysobacterales bacterium]|jgi:hypothetical protein
MPIRTGIPAVLAFVLAVVAVTAPSPARCDLSGEHHPWFEDDFLVSLGSFLPNKSVKMNADGQVPGSEIDFTNGLDATSDEITPSGTLRWKFGDKWSLWGQYFKTSDSGEKTIDGAIIWDDVEYQAGATLEAGVDLTVTRIFFGRIFSKGEQYEFGAGAGLHWLKLGAFVQGEAYIGDETAAIRRESVSAHAPLPNIGAWYWYEFSPRWLLTTRVDWLGATIGEYSGDLWNANAGINFQAWKNVGFRLSYQWFKLNVDVDKDDWHGGTNLTYEGPFASINFNW